MKLDNTFRTCTLCGIVKQRKLDFGSYQENNISKRIPQSGNNSSMIFVSRISTINTKELHHWPCQEVVSYLCYLIDLTFHASLFLTHSLPFFIIAQHADNQKRASCFYFAIFIHKTRQQRDDVFLFWFFFSKEILESFLFSSVCVLDS